MNKDDLVQVVSAVSIEQQEVIGSIGRITGVVYNIGLSNTTIIFVIFSDYKVMMFYPNQLIEVFKL